MASAEARHYHEIHELPVVFANKETRKVYWSEVFENNPKIVKEPQEGQKVVVVENYPGRRPYILKATKERYFYNPNYFNEPGEIFLTEEEKAKSLPGVVIVEPHTKQQLGFSRNKAWPWENWQRLVSELDLPWLQLGPAGTKTLKGVRFIETARFRDAIGYLNGASLIVTTDGAMHHAAAALQRPSVVLWGGASDPNIAGYKTHKNIRRETETCGSIKDCDHCKRAMGRITVEEVKEAILEVRK